MTAFGDTLSSVPGQPTQDLPTWTQAGDDHLHFHQIGPDQDAFFAFWERELAPALRERADA